VEDLPDSLRVSLKRNAGVIIKIVLDDSPAFYANILPGDVLVSIDNQSINSMRDFPSVIRPYVGKRVAFTIIRDGQEMVIPLQLNAR
jgi:S1-C subfamily serine protease